eukprot:7589140-Lingulodinium_polyedra.AAC.1
MRQTRPYVARFRDWFARLFVVCVVGVRVPIIARRGAKNQGARVAFRSAYNASGISVFARRAVVIIPGV